MQVMRKSPSKKSSFQLIKRSLSYAKAYKRSVVIQVVLAIALSLLSLVNPYLIKLLIDDVLLQQKFSLFFVIVAVFAINFVLVRILTLYKANNRGKLMQKIDYDVRTDFFRHLQGLHLGFFHNIKTGEITTRLEEDAKSFNTFATLLFEYLLIDISTFIFLAAVSLHLNWQVTVLALVVAPFYIIAQRRFTVKVRTQQKALRKQAAAITSYVYEIFSGIRLVKEFTQEDGEIKRYSILANDLAQKNVRMNLLEQISDAVMKSMGFLPVLIVIGFGGYQVIQGLLSIGSLMALYAYVQRLFDPLAKLANYNITLQKAIIGIERVFEFMDEKPTVQEKAGAKILENVKGDIEFRNVSFAYHQIPIVENFSLYVRHGQHIGITGPSGIGKSTLINLLLRFYDPDGGSILIDGKPISEFTLKSLRDNIGVVSQETIMFNTTIKENISYGKPNATDEDIIQAAKETHIHDFITQLPNRYETIVGERGVKLSGGEKQRLSIARTLLKNPPIIILDEATSSVDIPTEKMVQKALSKLTQGKTTIIITHRLQTLQEVDYILFIKDNKIFEGSFEELTQKIDQLY